MLGATYYLGLLVSCVLATPTGAENEGQIWAVLVAGSNHFVNYRHQADVCHAYQIFHRHGVSDSNIIVMMYDDIAYNEENPDKGVIINRPGGPNVYDGVVKDYTGNDVNPENFINILTGNGAAMKGIGSGKVLMSGPNDHVFVNFVDHGASGMIGFPNSFMYAHQLIQALKTMHKKKMYKKLVFYLEACESGSMFEGLLPKNIDIFATTAANATQSSCACYWSDRVRAYLGDEYSVSWLEDIESEEHHRDMTTETLLTQYHNVVKRVTLSQPQMYGDEDLDNDHVADFTGVSQSSLSVKKSAVEPITDAVSSRDVALETLRRKIELSNTEEGKKELIKKREKLLKGRKTIDDLFDRILRDVTKENAEVLETMGNTYQPLSMEMMPCYQTLVENFSSTCVNINRNTYALSHMYKLANLCSSQYSSTDDILGVFTSVCDEEHRTMKHVD